MSGPRPNRTKTVLLLGLVVSLGSACEASTTTLGRKLFEGDVAASARVAGHAAALPTQASRCINCHDLRAEVDVDAAAGSLATPALAAAKVPLASSALLQARPRRGGPPSRFDQASFCHLLRTGVDPAGVLLPQAMPRYELDASQCAALWAYVSGGRA